MPVPYSTRKARPDLSGETKHALKTCPEKASWNERFHLSAERSSRYSLGRLVPRRSSSAQMQTASEIQFSALDPL